MIARLLHLGHPLVLARHRHLVLQLVRRDIRARYQGSVLGVGWGLAYPLILLAAYTFVFRSVFKARWPGGGDSTSEFTLQLFAGLVIFNMFADLLVRAPGLVLEQPNLVKRVVFPLEILSWVSAGSVLFHAGLACAILVGAIVSFGPGLQVTALAAPLVFAAVVPYLLGIGWLLSGLGVFVRDISHAVGAVTSMLLFVSPVLYPTSALPEFLRDALWLNPLTLPIENLRLVLLKGEWPHWAQLASYTLVGLAFAFAAHRLFERVRPAFADEV